MRATWLAAVLFVTTAWLSPVAAQPAPRPMKQPTPFGCINQPLSPSGQCPDFRMEFDQDRQWFASMWSARNSVALDSAWGAFCPGRPEQRLPDGTWRLAAMGDAVWDVMADRHTWTAYRIAIDEWRSEHPDSVASQYVDALYWQAYAYDARGGEYAASVPPEAWSLYRERNRSALASLRRMGDAIDTCPAPTTLLIGLLFETGANANELRAAYDHGRLLFPEYHPIVLAMARTKLPEWGGSAIAFDRFAREAAASSASFEGDGLYARIYDYYESRRSESSPPLLSPRITWPKRKAGYAALQARYPTSLRWTLQRATQACRAGDRDDYLQQRVALRGYEGQTDGRPSLDVCDIRFDVKR